MFKNQLQELAQRSCFNLPSYACIREGPDHAPRFRASVNFNGEIFESPTYCPTLRQAEHAAAEVALNVLSSRGPSRSLTARVLDETGIYKNLLQETAHRAGLNLPVYTTVRSGPGHVPIFTCTVELAGMNFTGEPAKTKKQAEKNAAIAAWSSLKKMPNLDSLANKEVVESRDEQDQAVVARVLSSFRSKDDSRYARRRDHNNQTRRRIVKSPHCSASSSSSNLNDSSLHYPHWRLLDLILDSALDGSSIKKQNSFVSLLPPPPSRTTSMILPPPTCPRENPSSPYSSNRQVRGKSPRRMQEIPIPLDEHQKDEDEWLGCGAKLDNITKKPIEKEASSSKLHSPFHFRNVPGNPGSSLLDHTRMHKESAAQISSRIFGSSLYPSPVSSSGRIPRPVYRTRGLSNQRMAPAVQIRSVIPVCAAPPSTIRPPQQQQQQQQQQKPSSSSQIPVADAEENNKTEGPTATPIQVISSSEFNNKLQL